MYTTFNSKQFMFRNCLRPSDHQTDLSYRPVGYAYENRYHFVNLWKGKFIALKLQQTWHWWSL